MTKKRAVIVGCLSVLTVVSVMSAVLIRDAMRRGQEQQCLANLRNIGMGIAVYQAESKGSFPPSLKHVVAAMRGKGAPVDCSVIIENTRRWSRFVAVFDCPAGGNSWDHMTQVGDPDASADYVYLASGANVRQVKPNMVVAYEPLSNHGGRGAGFLYGDGSARFLPEAEAKALIASLDDGTSPLLPRSGVTRKRLNELAWEQLSRRGPLVVLMRHAETDPGGGDPPNFNLADRSTQRNLNALGRDHAIAIGERLVTNRVNFDRVISSPWFRCRETAESTFPGVHVEIEPALGAKADPGAAQAFVERMFVASQGSGQRVLLVTHASTIRKLTGYEPAPAEMLLLLSGNAETKFQAGPSLLERDWSLATATTRGTP